MIAPTIRRGGGIGNTFKKAAALYRREGFSGIIRGLKIIAALGRTGVSEYGKTDYNRWLRSFETLHRKERTAMRAQIDKFPHKPVISVLMPAYQANLSWLIEAIGSVQQQIYPHWQLCISDDASSDLAIRPMLERFAAQDRRINVKFRDQNGGISAASNSALELAHGEWIALLDHDDRLSEDALFRVAEIINLHPETAVIYSDEDKIDQSGTRFDPYFKCDWNLDLFLSQNLVSHLGAFRTDLVRGAGGFRNYLDGSQDYDLALRCIERIAPSQIQHIPHVLYHWRVHENSTALSQDAKPYAAIAAERALNEHFDRLGVAARSEFVGHGYRTHYGLPNPPPSVSLIIPTRNGATLLAACVNSILKKTSYPSYGILIVDNGSDDPAALDYLLRIESDPRVKLLRDPRDFNYSVLNNAAVAQASGDIIGFLNSDLEVISESWLAEMVSIAVQPDVAAVGARLWYPNHTLQHGGVVLGLGASRVAGHAHDKMPAGHHGYFGRADLISSFSAVSAACMIIRKSIFEELGGFNEANLAVAFNDVDLCLRARARGYRNVWTPYAELFHHESATRGADDTAISSARFAAECAYMKQTWGELLLRDPAYSPNLSLDRGDFSLAWPPRQSSVKP